MVSNLAKRITLIIALLTLSLSTYGQSVKGHYVSKTIDGGTLYHLLPKTLFHSESNELSYDLTYSSASDSITMSITFVSPEITKLDAMKVESQKMNVKDGLTRLYIEPKGKEWIHRYSMSTKAEPFFNLYTPKTTPQITLYNGDDEYIYTVKESAWKKYAPIGSRIFEMLKLDRDN